MAEEEHPQPSPEPGAADDDESEDGGSALCRTRSPLSPNSAVVAAAILNRTRTDSLEHRTRANSPRDSTKVFTAEGGTTAAPFETVEVTPRNRPRLDSGSRSRSIAEGLKPESLPPPSPAQSDSEPALPVPSIPVFRRSTALTSTELAELGVKPAEHQRAPPPLKYAGTDSFNRGHRS